MRADRTTRERAKKLRREMTRAETILWTRLQRGQLMGLHFRKQHPEGRFIPDFVCVKADLIVEVDGATHSSPEERAHDERRRKILEAQGWTILRVWNDDLYRNEDGVVEMIGDWALAGVEARKVKKRRKR